MKYNLEYDDAVQMDTGTWHNFNVLVEDREIATCCMFVWSVSGILMDTGEMSESGTPSREGLHFGDGGDWPDEEHDDLDLSTLEEEALTLIRERTRRM